MWYYSGSGRIQLEMTLEQARSASHSGQCDADVAELMRVPKIHSQLNKIDPEELSLELAEYGAWDEEERADHQANLERLVWLAAGQIVDDEFERRRA